MRRCLAVLTCLVLAVALIVMDFYSSASAQGSKEAPALTTGQGAGDTLTYKPPMRGAPAGGGRIAAAVRGKEGEIPTLFALAPDHVGLTCEKQPVLYWYVSRPTTARIEFTLNDEQKGKTLVKADLPAPKGEAVEVIKISDYKVELSPGVVYQWFITMESDPDQPAKDVYNGGSIMYQEPSADLKTKLQAAGAGTPRIYAGEGLWYDALSATWKPGKPGDEKSAGQQRVALLKQVGFGASGPGKSKSALDSEEEVLRYLGK